MKVLLIFQSRKTFQKKVITVFGSEFFTYRHILETVITTVDIKYVQHKLK